MKTITIDDKIYSVHPVVFADAAEIFPLIDPTFAAIRNKDLSKEVLFNLAKIVYFGLRRKHPQLTEADILNSNTTIHDMINAALTVTSQMSVIRKEEPPTGEAPGDGNPPI